MPRSIAVSLRQHLLEHLKRRLADDPPPLRLVFWDGETFEFAHPPMVILTMRSPAVGRMFASGNIARLGDAYVAGELSVEGSVQDILRVGIALAERIGRLPMIAPITRALHWMKRRHTRDRDTADIKHHYDVSNEFYRLWLDQHLIYSCAYFISGSENIDAAQEQKLDHICRKLRLRPGDHVLDIGCGWGGLLLWAAMHYGVTAVGVTLSERQYQFASDRISNENLAGRVEVRHQDYRAIPGADVFDKVVSVGMYEHVGLKNLPLYFSGISRLLKPGGALLNHGIVTTDPNGRAQGPPGGEFIDRYVFPGGELPPLSRVIYEVARCGLEAIDMEDLRPHYALTLMHWVHRFERRANEVIEAAGADRYRVWRLYLGGMAYAFDRGWLSVAQVLAYKPAANRPAPRPWTRDHQYNSSDTPLATALDWERGILP
ncbi:MAG: cyclopropane-fatty-acyl-phospholipid synthase family protein [Methylocella sp.]